MFGRRAASMRSTRARRRAMSAATLCGCVLLTVASLIAQDANRSTPPSPGQTTTSPSEEAERALDARLKELDTKIAQAKNTEALIESWGPSLATISLWTGIFSAVMAIIGVIFGTTTFILGGR